MRRFLTWAEAYRLVSSRHRHRQSASRRIAKLINYCARINRCNEFAVLSSSQLFSLTQFY